MICKEDVAFFTEIPPSSSLRHGDRRQMFFGGGETQNVFDLAGNREL